MLTFIFLNLLLFVGSYLAGYLPIAFNLSPAKLRLLTIFGAGLLLGAALVIIIPEGIDSLYSVQQKSSLEKMRLLENHGGANALLQIKTTVYAIDFVLVHARVGFGLPSKEYRRPTVFSISSVVLQMRLTLVSFVSAALNCSSEPYDASDFILLFTVAVGITSL
ncbi:hypothetical protein PHET_02605 [Paragonimus heterotremus]|uniref:Uncharacterized protein n=1 Tax=Paragonimus heterotremus TaxID=100268 RepID=A0A8J4TL20_9TREM|nr:hypothetical protein PHET_02605 [Paragonimus heterotremus]